MYSSCVCISARALPIHGSDDCFLLQGRIKPYVFDGMAVGPNRVWLPHAECPGLSMTRAFGDQLGASVGVSSEPEICQVTSATSQALQCISPCKHFLTNLAVHTVIGSAEACQVKPSSNYCKIGFQWRAIDDHRHVKAVAVTC